MISLKDEKALARLDNSLQAFRQYANVNAGFPCNQAIDFSILAPFLSLNINNLGDPFSGSQYRINTQDYEREVLDFSADLLQLQGDYRGYVASCSTEGNFYGISLGIQRYPDAVVYYSKAGHYSLDKICRLTRTPACVLDIQPSGEMDYQALATALQQHHDKPAVVNVTVGTTMTEASDNIQTVVDCLAQAGIQDYHIHVDGAFSGIIKPFTSQADQFAFTEHVHSYVISGHKFLGTPMPCSIALSRQKLSAEHVEYANLIDSTIGGSRNGHTSLFLWYALQCLGKEGLQQWVSHCIELTQYAVEAMQAVGIDAWCNPETATVVFPKPSADFNRHWWLLTEANIAHMVLKSWHTRAWVDDFIQALKHDYKG